MDIVLAGAALIGGLAALIKGADWLVGGGSAIARKFGVSELAIGLTIVAFGTSLPELTVNLISSFSNASDIAIGNVVGSNIANTLLILGIAAFISPLAIKTSTVWKEIPLCLLASVVLWIMANDAIIDGTSTSVLSRSDGLTLVAFFFIFLWYTFGLQRVTNGDDDAKSSVSGLRSAIYILAGLIALAVGGKLAVDGAIEIALMLGLSQALIGLTVVAVGTSLPELATSAVAAYRGKADIAVGNIVGSNIFNIFWILGVSASILPLTFDPALNIDVTVVVISTLLLFYVTHTGAIHRRLLFWNQHHGHVINRIEGGLLLSGYAAYIAYIVWRG